MASFTTKRVNYKTDFSLLEKSETGYDVPFRFKYFTSSPSRAFVASYDGENFENCHVTDEGNLVVGFDNHRMGLGLLQVERTYYLTNEDYQSGIADQVVSPQKVVAHRMTAEDEEELFYIELALTGCGGVDALVTVEPWFCYDLRKLQKKLPDGEDGQVLKLEGGEPTWQEDSFSGKVINVEEVKPFVEGGTITIGEHSTKKVTILDANGNAVAEITSGGIVPLKGTIFNLGSGDSPIATLHAMSGEFRTIAKSPSVDVLRVDGQLKAQHGIVDASGKPYLTTGTGLRKLDKNDKAYTFVQFKGWLSDGTANTGQVSCCGLVKFAAGECPLQPAATVALQCYYIWLSERQDSRASANGTCVMYPADFTSSKWCIQQRVGSAWKPAEVFLGDILASENTWTGANNFRGGLKKEGFDVLCSVISIEWSELKAIRDAGGLWPGQEYRITDYSCTTIKSYTRSAGHFFDIIVRADSANKLNENARAVPHAGDTYFSGSKLEAWELKYCLDNDTDRFSWADAANGRGVVYWLNDEFGNECPYDFKSMQFKRWKITATTTAATDMVGKYMSNDISMTGFTVDADDFIWCYTFSSDASGGEQVDYSLDKSKIVYGNVIREYSYSGRLLLSYIVFFGNDCYGNVFDIGCQGNTFGSGCYGNTFGSRCYGNAFGNGCRDNSFGSGCYRNSFGSGCRDNSFGSGCRDNSFGSECYSNSFGSGCYSNSFVGHCSNNAFGHECSYSRLLNYCISNRYGNDVSFANIPVMFVRNLYVSDGVKYINIISTDTTATAENQLQNVIISRGVSGAYSSILTITIPDRNLDYETKVGKNSAGVLKVYCEADLV